MKITRRKFIQTAGAVVSASMLPINFLHASEGDGVMSPAINPEFLTGSQDNWPLAELAAAGYRGLELTPASIAKPDILKQAKDANLRPICVNALPELRPYLTGSLNDAVDYRRRDSIERLTRTIEIMNKEQIPFLLVGAGRVAENYQSREEARELLVASLTELSAKAGDVTILVELVPNRMLWNTREVAELVDKTAKSNVAAALDIGHTILNGENIAEAVKTLGSRLKYIQLHDANIRPGYPRLDSHLPMGTSGIKCEEIKSAVGDLPVAVNITAPSNPLAAAKDAMKWIRV